MIATLQDLLGEVPEHEFRDRLCSRELTLWRGADANRFAPLLDWAALDRLLDEGDFPTTGVRITRRGTPVPGAFYVRDGRLDADRIRQLLDQGASLILFPLDDHVPSIEALLASVRAGTKDRVRGGAIVTTGSGGALAVHFDAVDLLIVQLEGTKRWWIHRTPVVNPVRGMRRPPPPDGGEAMEETLHPGDLLLLPAGYWHHCQNGPSRSVHFGLFLNPPSLARAADGLRARLLSDPEARAPLTRDGTHTCDESTLRDRLIAEISQMSMADFFPDQEEYAPPA